MQDLKHWSVLIDDANLCWLTLDVSGKSVNVLTHAVMAELGQIIDWVESQSMIAGVGMLSGKPGGFVYGADIAEFELLASADDVLQHMQMVHGLFNRIDSLDLPTIVGIDGIAVGGGLEIALTFDRIITTAGAKTKLGFPEVNLGILPGYGGSGRGSNTGHASGSSGHLGGGSRFGWTCRELVWLSARCRSRWSRID